MTCCDGGSWSQGTLRYTSTRRIGAARKSVITCSRASGSAPRWRLVSRWTIHGHGASARGQESSGMTIRTEADGGGTTLRVVLPGIPPSVNHMYRRFTVGGRTMDVITRHAKAWMEQAAWAARQAALESGWSLVPKGQK